MLKACSLWLSDYAKAALLPPILTQAKGGSSITGSCSTVMGRLRGTWTGSVVETSTVLQALCCYCGEEGAEPQGKALNLHTVHLCPDPSGRQLWVVRERTRLWIQVVKIV